MCKKLTTEEFIQKAKKIHGDKYDYSLVEYKDAKTKIKIICPKHGKFEQIPKNHLSGYQCPKCVGGVKYSQTEFLNKAKQKHGFKYDYSKVKYKNSLTKVIIICAKHGEFIQRPGKHLLGQGCPKCSPGKILTTREFIKRANKIHSNKYNYSLTVYKNTDSKVKIICPKHGVFLQTPYKHMSGQCCPHCNSSKGENKIEQILIEHNIFFHPQKRFKECFFKKKLSFDFFLSDFKTCIEFQGLQHFKPTTPFGGIDAFNLQQTKDEIKKEFCHKNNYPFLICFKKPGNNNIYNFVDSFDNLPIKLYNILKKEKFIKYSLEEYENFKQNMLKKD
jgi:hypothetical protein